MKNSIHLVLFLAFWYYLSYQFFIYKSDVVGDSPQLRARFGTILSHSSDSNGKAGEAIHDPNAKAHTYCYYPKGSTQYSGKSGEYIIKREDNGQCSGWYGAIIFYEGSWVSEKEKIWWSKTQKLEDNLTKAEGKSSNI